MITIKAGGDLPLLAVANGGRATIDLSRGPVGPGSDITGAEIEAARDDAAASASAAASSVASISPGTIVRKGDLMLVATDPAYGAVGNWNGTTGTDNTTALQAFFDAVHSTGKIGYIPPGNYKITSSLALPKGQIVGAGRGATTLTYTGSGTALTMHDPATAEQKLGVYAGDFTLNATTAACAINCKGMTYGVLEGIEINGAATSGAIVSGSVAVLYDGSYGTTIGCWYNELIRPKINGFDTGVKYTGVDNAGQANENVIRNGRIGLYNKGVWVDQGDNIEVYRVDLTCTVAGSKGVYSQDEATSVIKCRFESTPTSIYLVAPDGTHGFGGRRATIHRNMFAAGAGCVGVEIEAGVIGTNIEPNYWSSLLGTRVVDHMAITSDSTKLARYTGRDITRVGPFSVTSGLNASGSFSDVALLGSAAGKSTRDYFGQPYQIRGITARLSNARTAGSLTATAKVGSTASSSLSVTLDATNTSAFGQFQAMGLDTNSGTSGVAVQVTTDATFAAGASPTVDVWVWVERTPA